MKVRLSESLSLLLSIAFRLNEKTSNSTYATKKPEIATVFLIPFVPLGYCKELQCTKKFENGLKEIRNKYPYWNKTNGKQNSVV